MPSRREHHDRRHHRAGDQAAEVRAPVDAGGEEADHHVDAEQHQHLGDVVAQPASGDDEGAHQAEDRAAGADGDRADVGEHVRRHPAAERREHVQRQVAAMAEDPLERRPDREQHVHVERDVQEGAVQERRGDQPPPLAADGDADGPHAPVAGDGVDADGELQQEDHHVHPDEGVRDQRLGDGRAAGDRRDPRPGRRRARHAVRALEADRCGHHALRADRPVAARAADARRPVRVPVAAGQRHRLRRGGVRHGGALLPGDVDRGDDDVLARAVVLAGAHGRDRVDDVARLLVGHLAEDAVLEVEPGGGSHGDEELRAVGVRAGVGHGEQVRAVEGQLGVELVLEPDSPGRRCRCRAGRRPGS